MSSSLSPGSPEEPRLPTRPGHGLLDNLGVKALSLLLAVLLWVVVGARTPTEGYVTVRVDPVLDSSLALLGGTPHVRALVSGRAADLVKLYAAGPAVRRVISGDAPDTLVLDVSPADVHIPPELSEVVRVLDVQPRSVTLRFAARATRRVDVVNDGRIRVGSGGTVKFEPGTVRISGPRGAVRGVRALHPVALTIAPGDTMSHLAELDTAGLGVLASPAQVRVRIAPERSR